MRHFIAFQKKRALLIGPGSSCENEHLAHQLNHELMAVGFVLEREAFEAVARLDEAELGALYSDLIGGIRRVVGGEGYEPIYRDFPQSVRAMSDPEFVLNALIHYWSGGAWRPEDEGHLRREFALEPVDYTPIGLLTRARFERIFTDLLYGLTPLSAFDKECVDWYLDEGGALEWSRIRLQETKSYVGQRLLSGDLEALPTRRATTVLRLWAAHSGGDEGLKTPTRFKSPSVRQRALLLATLDRAVDLEDSFKSRRGMWLRLLFYLHPGTPEHRARYPRVAAMAARLRNEPKGMRTFNSRVEALIEARDPQLLVLLAERPGAYMRRLDHLVRLFGLEALHPWLALEPRFDQLLTAYNHFSTRAEAQAGRAAVLADQAASQLVTYEAHAPLPGPLVAEINALLMAQLRRFRCPELDGAVFVNRGLYFTPLAVNNRASALELGGEVIGQTERYTEGRTLRMYVHWEGRSDIDLSGFIITRQNDVVKVGWNGLHATDYLVYSGDNTGLSEKNAEYLDLDTRRVPEEIEWIVVEARIFRGPESFAAYGGAARIGWMSLSRPEANLHWQPKSLARAMALESQAQNAYLMAYHPRSKNLVYLDLAMGDARVSSAHDALRMRLYLERFVTLDEGAHDTPIAWDRLNQGHILELLGARVVEAPQGADFVFDEGTTSEEVSRLMSEAERIRP